MQQLKTLLLFILVFFSLAGVGQNLPLSNAFAHNDYWHQRPLFDALENGFTHIEADIYLRNNELVVAHVLPVFQKKRTLEQLYLKPLADCMSCDSVHLFNYPVTLMIDIKSDAGKTFTALQTLLGKYKLILTSYENGQVYERKVTIVLTGHKPIKMVKRQQVRYVFMDDDLKMISKQTDKSDVYPIASCKYSSILQWQGQGTIPIAEKRRLQHHVALAHKYGKKVRLWASPENTAVWTELLQAGVDLINTDQLVKLRSFLLNNIPSFANNPTLQH